MVRTVRGVLETPEVLRLDEPVELPLHVPVEVAITEPTAHTPSPEPTGSTFLAWAETVQLDAPGLPADYSERWEEYLAEEERERNR